ncbi:MAG TPA: HDIG domain-containing protein, partial [Spirochaetota bacterium]|nr:HDIG domain-containing protein [Spirochaetota bacterium]
SSILMKELFDSAVGTYNHSINVSNLAAAAASEISANTMLAKVGGLYHDIGKIETPEYFIENQGEFNIHTQIKPTMSATVIKAHVKKGLELAKNHHLPKEVSDIINQHHGDGLIKYFYDMALKSNDANKGELKEEIFRYSGEKPQFVESAIVLLSDQVEAASRVLKKPSVSSVEKLIEGIIDEKFQEGLLDDSGLTLKDLTRIKKAFVKLIIGMYHSRIEYPTKDDKDKDKEKKDYAESKPND